VSESARSAPEEEARERFIEALAELELDPALAGALTTSWKAEGDRKRVWQGALRSLGFDPGDVEQWWDRSEESERNRDFRRARWAGSNEKAAALGALTLMLVYAAPSGDSGQIRQALCEIDPEWTKDPGTRAWSAAIAAIARESPDSDVRLRALQTLEAIGDPSVADALLDVLATDDDTSVRVVAAYAVLGIAETLRDHPRARAILEAAADARSFDLAPNLARYATQALERIGAAAGPAVDVDWTTIVADQLSPDEVQALLGHAGMVSDTLVRFYGAMVSQPSSGSVGTLLRLFDAHPDLALVHGDGRGHLFARVEILREVQREAAVADYRQLVEAVRGRGHRTGFVPSVSI
jgi:hypothetical protein